MMIMKKHYLYMAAAAALLTGCAGRNRTSDIDNFEVDFLIKTGMRQFTYTDTTPTLPDEPRMNGRALISASIEWPEKIGSSSLRALQDSLISITFADHAGARGIDKVMMNYLADTSVFGLEGVEWASVANDSVIDDDHWRQMMIDKTARPVYYNTRYISYRITESTDFGGAHGMTTATYLTYNLDEGKVMTAADMFVSGSDEALTQVIMEQLAADLHTTVAGLDDAGVFTDQLTGPGVAYLDDGSVVFHYDPYAIGPYSMGAVDVRIWAGEIEHLLTPEARSLLD